MIKKILYPNLKTIKHRLTYYSYLLLGFQCTDYPVELSNDLIEKSFSEPLKNVRAIDIYTDKKKYRVWYDWSDFQRAVHPKLIKGDDLYFKVECSLGHIYRYGIKPIGHGVTETNQYYSILDKLRNINEYKRDIFFIGRATSPKPRLKSERITACEIINRKKYNSLLRVTTSNKRPLVPKSLRRDKNTHEEYKDFLMETAKSKINLLLPGIGELTWRVSETLGMGACALMPKLSTILPGNPKNCWIEVERDYSDLIDKIDYYLEHDTEREKIAKNGLEYYKKWLSPKAQAKNILQYYE